MAERPGSCVRPIGMKALVLCALVAPLVLAGCGDSGDPPRASSSPSSSTSACRGQAAAPPVDVKADLDGDGARETVAYWGPSTECPSEPSLTAVVAGKEVRALVQDELPLTAGDLHVVRISGRTGELLLATAHHPRGGFQARLIGYADGKLEELTVDGSPIFPFVATDVLTDPISATCVDGGFAITTARRHEPVGVVAAWDVYRTTYAVDGNAVTAGAATEIADNVLDKDLPKKYSDLVHYRLFESCRVPTS